MSGGRRLAVHEVLVGDHVAGGGDDEGGARGAGVRRAGLDAQHRGRHGVDGGDETGRGRCGRRGRRGRRPEGEGRPRPDDPARDRQENGEKRCADDDAAPPAGRRRGDRRRGRRGRGRRFVRVRGRLNCVVSRGGNQVVGRWGRLRVGAWRVGRVVRRRGRNGLVGRRPIHVRYGAEGAASAAGSGAAAGSAAPSWSGRASGTSGPACSGGGAAAWSSIGGPAARSPSTAVMGIIVPGAPTEPGRPGTPAVHESTVYPFGPGRRPSGPGRDAGPPSG